MNNANKFLAIRVGLFGDDVVTASTLKAVIKKAKIYSEYVDGKEFMIFKADGDVIRRIGRNGHEVKVW